MERPTEERYLRVISALTKAHTVLETILDLNELTDPETILDAEYARDELADVLKEHTELN
jgi:hypothetical protein